MTAFDFSAAFSAVPEDPMAKPASGAPAVPSTHLSTGPFTCESCGHESTVTYYDTVNAAEDPSLAAEVRELKPFSYTCPQCGAEYLLDYSMLYVDPDARVEVFCACGENGDQDADDAFDRFSNAEDAERASVAVRLNPRLATRRRVTASPDDLVEKVEIFAAGLDDRILELHKYLLGLSIEETEGVRPNGLVFTKVDDETSEIVYDAYFDDEVGGIAAPRAGYDELAANADVAAYLAGEPYDFFVDATWAEDAILAIMGDEGGIELEGEAAGESAAR